jgi:thymidylate synthase
MGFKKENMIFNKAQEAFEYYYELLSNKGEEFNNTKALFNIGFKINNPLDNKIKTSWRKWNHNYAEYEWQWYLSGDKSAELIAKRAKIWYNCMDIYGNVNSNYGYQWNRGNQLEYVINELKHNPTSRRASISIYDAKDRFNFENDTPCTYAINFTILNNKLCMSVMMRSNDLWFGFCNDQYCFSKLQEMISNELSLEIGWYYHFVNNIHLYKNFLNKKI